MTLKQYIEKAKSEKGLVEVKFIKVTNDQERIVKIATNADVSCKFDDNVVVSPKTLKTITKTHDRVYSSQVKYVGSLLTFPELIDDPSKVSSSNVTMLDDGTAWQWRRLYVEQILEVKYNDKVVYSSDDPFKFNLVGEDGEQLTVVSKADYDAKQREIADKATAKTRDEAERAAEHKAAVALAKTLTAEDCRVDLGYVNGWSDKSPEDKKRTWAICIKHNWLVRTDPEHHHIYSNSSTHGDHHYYCECGYAEACDSTD